MRYRGVAFLLVGVFTPALAAAQSSEDTLLNDCYSLRRANRHAASLPRCEEAVSRFPSGRTLTQLALTEMALERWVDAANRLTAALADRTHPWMQANRPSVEDALRTARAHVGVLEVATNVPSATLSLPGSEPAPASSAVFAAPGRVTVTLRARDGRILTRDVTLTAGQTAREQMDFPAAPTLVATHPAAAPVHAPPSADRPLPLTTPAAGTSTRRVLAWTAAGAAVAGFGFGIVSWQLREAAVADYLATPCPNGPAPDLPTTGRCTPLHRALGEDVSRWEALTAVGLVAGGAFAVTSAILFATEPSRRAPLTTWACAPSIGVPGGQCTVRF